MFRFAVSLEIRGDIREMRFPREDRLVSRSRDSSQGRGLRRILWFAPHLIPHTLCLVKSYASRPAISLSRHPRSCTPRTPSSVCCPCRSFTAEFLREPFALTGKRRELEQEISLWKTSPSESQGTHPCLFLLLLLFRRVSDGERW